MALPKKRFSKRKKLLKKRYWSQKAEKKAQTAFNWAKLVLTRLNK